MEYNNEIKNLLEENLKLNHEILSLCKEIEHHNKLARIYGFIRTIIIIIPILLTIFYLIPFLGDSLRQITGYNQIMRDVLK